MWNDELSVEIATLLGLIANPPNLRSEEGIKRFDGGRMIEDTGLTVFELDDGTEVFYGSGLNRHLTIKFPTGREVNIDVTEQVTTRVELPQCEDASTEGTPWCSEPDLCPTCGSDRCEETVEDFRIEMPDRSIMVVPQIPVRHCSVCQARWLSPVMSDAVDEFVRRGGTWRSSGDK